MNWLAYIGYVGMAITGPHLALALYRARKATREFNHAVIRELRKANRKP